MRYILSLTFITFLLFPSLSFGFNLSDLFKNTTISLFQSKCIASCFGFDEDDYDQLIETNKCINCSLRNANLKEVNLSEANLKGADLSEADLSGANLKGANLTKAILGGANLTGANLSSANLTRASLGGANLTGANLTRADFTSARLSWANLTDAKFNQTNLNWASLRDANLFGVDVTQMSFKTKNISYPPKIISDELRKRNLAEEKRKAEQKQKSEEAELKRKEKERQKAEEQHEADKKKFAQKNNAKNAPINRDALTVKGISVGMSVHQSKNRLIERGYTCVNNANHYACYLGNADIIIGENGIDFSCENFNLCGYKLHEAAGFLNAHFQFPSGIDYDPEISLMLDEDIPRYCGRGKVGDILCVRALPFFIPITVTLRKGALTDGGVSFD